MKKITLFNKEKFNNFTDRQIEQLIGKINEIEITHKKDLPPYLIKIREKHIRSHEPWTQEEKALLQETLSHTNDIKLISQIFGRSPAAIESCIEKLAQEEPYEMIPESPEMLKNLNDRQREAVVSEKKRLLLLAGAGSGKTKTLLQKLIYLIEEKGVNPSNILAITFTKNAANEMIDRLIISADNSGSYESILGNKSFKQKEVDQFRKEFIKKYKWIDKLTIRTFHSLCYSIMRNDGVSEFDNRFRIIGDAKPNEEEFSKYIAPETTFEIFSKLLIKNCENNDFLLNLKRYILDYMVDRIQDDSKKRKTLPRDGKFYTSLNGTKVRSKSEQYIADWLYRHNIRFVYEPEVNFKDFPFKPDFYIPEANLYLEHVSNKSYPTKDKDKQFSIANKTLIKTYEEQTRHTELFSQVREKSIKNRLPADYEFTSALSFEEEFKGYHDWVNEFIKLVNRVVDMIKVDGMDVDLVYEKSQKDQHERVRDFYKLAIPLLRQYESYCTNKSYLDFNDLILKTISLFKNKEDIAAKSQNKFHYVLVDEFQDVNNIQVELINLLLTPESQLFCVGDDWQSIYGFRGSNVDYIINFKKYFPESELIKLSLNYRSTQHIVGASNEVIKYNKHKVEKEISSLKNSNQKILIFHGNNEDDCIDFAVDQARILQNEYSYQKEDILFLYRRSKMYNPYFKRFREEGLAVSGKTIHGAKGLEAKAVFIVGLTDGYGGFPDIWMEDRIFQVIRESDHELLLEEERRLFYVALTRAKDQLFLLSEKGNESMFLKEIPENLTSKSGRPLKPFVEKLNLCSSCNFELLDFYRYCPSCGTPINQKI
jgi:DNA helicase-4